MVSAPTLPNGKLVVLHTVEIRHIGNNLADARDEIRSWLDRNGIIVAGVEHSLGGPGIAFRLSFSAEAEAAAFAEAFQGRLNQGDDPNGAPLWTVSRTIIQSGAAADPSVALGASLDRRQPDER